MCDRARLCSTSLVPVGIVRVPSFHTLMLISCCQAKGISTSTCGLENIQGLFSRHTQKETWHCFLHSGDFQGKATDTTGPSVKEVLNSYGPRVLTHPTPDIDSKDLNCNQAFGDYCIQVIILVSWQLWLFITSCITRKPRCSQAIYWKSKSSSIKAGPSQIY